MCAWLLATSMKHWGLMDLADVPSSQQTLHRLPAPPSCPEWGPNSEPLFFYERLVEACTTMAAALDPGSRQALVLLSNLVVLHGLLQQEAAGVSHPHDLSSHSVPRTRPAASTLATAPGHARRSSAPDTKRHQHVDSSKASRANSYVGAAHGWTSSVERRMEVGRRLSGQAGLLLRRLAVYECSRMETAGQRVALACCSAQLSGKSHDLRSEVQAPAEEALNELARRLDQHSMLMCLRRRLAQAAMRALDASLLDSMLQHGIACTFDAALHVKDTAANLERHAHGLALDLGFAPASRMAPSEPPASAAPPQAMPMHRASPPHLVELSLPLTRQVTRLAVPSASML